MYCNKKKENYKMLTRPLCAVRTEVGIERLPTLNMFLNSQPEAFQ